MSTHRRGFIGGKCEYWARGRDQGKSSRGLVWEGYNTQHVTPEPHIVRPWGRPDLMGIRRAPLLFIQHHPLQTPHFHPHPRLPSPTGCINSASLAPTFTSPERPLCEPKGMLDKKRDCAFHRAQHGESNEMSSTLGKLRNEGNFSFLAS